MKNLSFNIDFDFCLKVFLFLGILLYAIGIDQNLLQLMILDYGPLLLFGLSIYFTPEREPRNYNIFLVLFLTILTAVLLNPIAYPVNLIHLISGCLLYYSITRSVRNVQSVVNALIIICLINIPFFILQYLGKAIICDRSPWELISNPGMMGRNYHLAYFIAIIIPLLLRFGKRGVIASGILACIIFVLKSYAAMFSLIAGLAVYVFFKVKSVRTKIIIFSIVVFIGTGIVASRYEEVKSKVLDPMRRGGMFYTLKSAFAAPLRGNGLGSFDVDVEIVGDREKNIPARYNSSYNQLFRTMYEIGPLAVLGLAYGLFRYFRKIWVADPCFMGALAAIVPFAMLHEVLRFARLSIIIVTIVALYEAYCLDKQKERVA